MARKIKPVFRQVKLQTEVDRIRRDRVVRVEKAGEIVVEAEIPGVAQADITITVQSNRVEIKGAKKESAPAGKARYLRLEREFGRFRRLIALPCAVVPDKARAFLDNGVLIVLLMKYQPDENVEIEIQRLKEDE
jgi:HSP20 family protein